jgi:ammonia channel protein AmtB
MFSLGFIPTYIVAKILNGANLLRVPKEVELVGLDFATQEAYEAAVADVTAAEKAMVK